jgi:hypothetical protein
VNNDAVICSSTVTNISYNTLTENGTMTVQATYPGSVTASVDYSASTPLAFPGTINETLTSSSTTPEVVTYTFTTSANGCADAITVVTVTVNPTPVVQITPSPQGICGGDVTAISLINFNGVSATTFSWVVKDSVNVLGAAPGDGSLINQVLTTTDGVNPGFVEYTVTPSANGCLGVAQDVYVSVSPQPVITNLPSELQTTICDNVTLNFLPTSSIAGTTYTWTSQINGPITTGVSPSGSGTIMDTPRNTGNVSGTVTYTIRPEFGGCYGNLANYVVTVHPVPTATASDVTICSGQNAFVPIFSTPNSVAGTTYSWTAIPTNNVVGAIGSDGSAINEILTLNDFNIGSVQFDITPRANNCDGPIETVIVTINPIATVDAGPDYEVCEPATITLTGNIGGSASIGKWIVMSGPSAGMELPATVSSGVVTATYTVNSVDIDNTVQFRLETNDPDLASGPCSLAFDLLDVKVRRRPTVILPADYIVCEPTAIALTGTIGGGAISGLWDIIKGNDAGLSATSVTGTTVTANYLVDSFDVSDTVIARLTTNDPDGVCTSEFAEIKIKVNQKARVFAPATLEQCQDVIGIALGGSIGGSTTNVVWSGGLGGFDDSANPNATYNYLAPNEVGTTVSLTLTAIDPDGSGPCGDVSTETLLKINPLPVVFFAGLPSTMTQSDNPVTLTANQTSIPGQTFGEFTITAIDPPTTPRRIGATSSNPVDNAEFDPRPPINQPDLNLGSSNITYTYTDQEGCTNAISKIVQVNPVTEASFSIPSGFLRGTTWEVCAQQGLVQLLGDPIVALGLSGTEFTAEPGQQDGSHTMTIVPSGNDFYIDTDGLAPDTYQVTYHFINQFGAEDFYSQDVKILAAPVAEISAIANNCIDVGVEFEDNSTIQSPAIIGYREWRFGDQITLVTADTVVSHRYNTAGKYKVTLVVQSTPGGCVSSDTLSVRVGLVPTVDFKFSSICNNDSTNFLNNTTGLISGQFQSKIDTFYWDFGDGITVTVPAGGRVDSTAYNYKTFGPAESPYHLYQGAGTYQAKLQVFTNDGCTADSVKQVFILPKDTIISIRSSAYLQTFNADDGLWKQEKLTQQSDTSWIWGIPDYSKDNSNAWYTGLSPQSGGGTSSYFANERSALNGPCFDLTALNRPMISFDYWLDTQNGVDGVVLQYSTNGGIDWFNVGVRGEGINWYDPQTLVATFPGGQPVGWSGNSNGWLNARFNLDTIQDRDQVRIRFALSSDNTTPSNDSYDGFAIDNVFIGDKSRNVLIENFTNSGNSPAVKDYLNYRFVKEDTSRNGDPDFRVIQYHLNYPDPDPLYEDNPFDQDARNFYYGFGETPAVVMDGRRGVYQGTNFTGLNPFAEITRVTIDRRALEDPEFEIVIDTVATTSDSVRVNLALTALRKYSDPVIVQAALIDDGMATYRNVFRKGLLGREGITTMAWDSLEMRPFISKSAIDVPISRPDSLAVIAYVFDKKSGVILQSEYLKLQNKSLSLVTGLAEESSVVNVYPNPSSGVSYLSLTGSAGTSGKSAWQLIDQRGVIVMKGDMNAGPNNETPLDVRGVANGLYIVKVIQPGGRTAYKKLIVNNMN